MNKDIFRQVSVAAALIITIVVNILSNALPFNGLSAPEIADSFDVFFVPAGYVFSIWSIIYLGLIAYAVFQALPAQRENPRLRQTGWWFVLSCAANSIWLFLVALRFLCPVRPPHGHLINFPDHRLSAVGCRSGLRTSG